MLKGGVSAIFGYLVISCITIGRSI